MQLSGTETFLEAGTALGYSNKQRLVFLNAFFDINRIHILTVAMWYGTFLKPGSSQIGKFIERLFTLLYYGGVLYKSKGGSWTPWNTYGGQRGPVTSVISHGARIIVQLPKAPLSGPATDNTFFTWLMGGMTALAGMGKKFASHTINQASPPEKLFGARKKYITEKKVGLKEKNMHHHVRNYGRHHRYNLPIGGSGNTNPWSGNRIGANGQHGHLYVYYQAPTHHTYGALMMGIESEAPGASGQTGHGHGMSGSSEEFTAFGVRKWVQTAKDNSKGVKDLGIMGEVGDKYDAMFIDLVGNGDQAEVSRVKRHKFSVEMLSNPPLPPPPLPAGFVSLMPSWSIWKKLSAGSGLRSRAGLTPIDNDLKAYHKIRGGNRVRRRMILNSLALKCGQWLISHPGHTRRSAVEALRDRVNEEYRNLR